MSKGKRSKVVLAIETVLALAIVVGVVWYFANVLRKMPAVPFSPRVELLVLAGLLYLLAHCCWATFWVRLLHGQGVNVSYYIGLRAYCISQFGKYVPGKVFVLVMRVGMLRPFHAHPIPVAVTTTYETLASMAAGALFAVLFLPALGVLPPDVSGRTTVLFAVAALPLGLGVLNKLAARIAKKRRGPHARPLPAPSIFLLAQGLLHGACGYGLLALSLGCAIRALVPDPPAWSAEAYAAEMAAVALAYVAGFLVVVAPGGLGAREIVLAAVLAPRFVPALGADGAAGMAVVVALITRLTWTIAELTVGLLLYARKPPLPPIHHDETIPIHHEKPHMPGASSSGPTPPAPLPEGKGEQELRNSDTPNEPSLSSSPFPSGRGAGGVGSALSLVIPVYNERESLAALHAEIAEVAAKLPERVEILFIDDGSKDGSWDIVRELAAKDERVRGIKFRRNFGKAAALAAGFGAARGSTIITMDADLQDDPHEIPHFLEALRNGLDVVSGWKKVRHDPWHKVFPSRVFNRFLSVLTGVYLHDHNCGMKAYKAEAIREVYLYGELHRFVPVLATARGFKVGELVIQHRARKFGSSKYGWKRFIKGGLDVTTVRLLTGFGRRPNHFLGSWGLTFGALGAFGFFLLLANLLVRLIDDTLGAGPMVQMVALILSVGCGLLGAQCLLAGLTAEMTVARKWLDNDPYSVAERTDGEQARG